MGIGKSNAKMYMEKQTGVTFQNVAGQDEAKESLQEVVDFLHNPEKYSGIGAKLPKGALLVGPACQGSSRRSGRPVLLVVRFGFCRDVCRCRSFPCA